MLIRLRNIFVGNVHLCVRVYVYTRLHLEEEILRELFLVLGTEEVHVYTFRGLSHPLAWARFPTPPALARGN